MTAALESDFTLKDGTIVHIRPIRPGDDHALIEIFKHLSPQSVYQRFFQALPELSPGMAVYLANAHYTDRMALVAEAGGEMIGVGRYERTSDPGVADLALVLLDEWQNRGLGRILLREILKVGKSNGIRRFRADVLAENRRMLRLLAQESQILEQKTEAGVASFLVAPHDPVPDPGKVL
jgi:GNAT superfamily N-acetyltransferase